MRIFVIIILIPILSGSSDYDFEDYEDDYPFDPARERLMKNIPAFIKRAYKEWSQTSSCIDRVLRSTPAFVSKKNSRWFAYKVRMPRRIGPVMEAYLLLEFQKISNSAPILSYNYSLEIRPMDRRLQMQELQAIDVVVSENMAELFFDITSHYHRVKAYKKKFIHLRVRFFTVTTANDQLNSKKEVPTFTFSTTKAFLITHEDNKNCDSFLKEIDWQSNRFLEFTKKKSMMRTLETQRLYPVDNNRNRPCKLTHWYVSFHSIGWNAFIIAPSGINANACSGVCSFPLVVNTTEHALLQSAVSISNGRETSVSCVPISTESATLVLHDDLNGSVYVIKYPNLVAKSCGCL